MEPNKPAVSSKEQLLEVRRRIVLLELELELEHELLRLIMDQKILE